MRIGISISDPGEEELARQGLALVHLQDMMVETARYLLSRGHAIAYGGDLTFEGNFNFADLLFQLSQSYGAKGRVKNYTAFPLYTKITPIREAELKHIAEIVRVNPEAIDSKWTEVRYVDATAEERSFLDEIFQAKTDHAKKIWSDSLTEMRRRMSEEIDCRIVLGGKKKEYRGAMPGVLEEAAFSARRSMPVFVDGRFGGAARDLALTIMEKNVPGLEVIHPFVSANVSGTWDEIHHDVLLFRTPMEDNVAREIKEIEDLFRIL